MYISDYEFKKSFKEILIGAKIELVYKNKTRKV
jgi:hypothetical protein